MNHMKYVEENTDSTASATVFKHTEFLEQNVRHFLPLSVLI